MSERYFKNFQTTVTLESLKLSHRYYLCRKMSKFKKKNIKNDLK